jgi:hypothetical protein
MIGSQTTNLTLNLSFDHNLCFICSNGRCKPNLDIYVSISFQWCKKKFKLMGFNPCNRTLKIWESIGIPTPNMGIHLGVWGFIPSHSFALLRPCNVIFGLSSWLANLQALALVARTRLGLRHKCLLSSSPSPCCVDTANEEE